MSGMRAAWIAGAILLAQIPALAQGPFAPLEQWKSAVLNGDQASLAKLYSVKPEPVTQAGKERVSLKDEWAFWASLKSSGMTQFNPRVLEITTVKGNTRLLLRISA